MFELKGHLSDLYWAQYSPDGLHIITASKDGTARVWNAKTGKELLQLIGHNNIIYMARYSRDGLRIVTTSRDSTIRIWEANSGKELLRKKSL